MECGLLSVPPLYSPFRPAIHPRHAYIDQRTGEWAKPFIDEDLRRKLITQDLGTFAARILPEGREEVVDALADFVIWLFGVDDGHCEEGELGTRPGQLAAALHCLLRVAQNPEVPMLTQDPLANGIRDLQRRVSMYAQGAGPVDRWINALREYFFSVVWEAGYRSHEIVPDLNNYTLMRIYNGATTVVFPFLEIAYGYELRASEWGDKRLRAASEMVSFVTTWDNDIFSYHKESRQPESRYYLNVLRVLMHHWGLAPKEALAVAIAQRDRVLSLYLRVCDELTRTGSPEVRQYVRSLHHYIRANQDWAIESKRYRTPDDPADLPWGFGDTPTDTSLEPLDIPAISWWWDLLAVDWTSHAHGSARGWENPFSSAAGK